MISRTLGDLTLSFQNETQLNQLLTFFTQLSLRVKNSNFFNPCLNLINYLQQKIQANTNNDQQLKTILLLSIDILNRMQFHLDSADQTTINTLFGAPLNELINLLPDNKKDNDPYFQVINEIMPTNTTKMTSALPASSATVPITATRNNLSQSGSSSLNINKLLSESGWYDSEKNDHRTLADLKRYYIPRTPEMGDRLLLHATNQLNRISNATSTAIAEVACVFGIDTKPRQDWNEILPTFYLGVIPAESDINSILNLNGVNGKGSQLMVFAIVEDFELKRQARPEVWAKYEVICRRLPMGDFTADMEPANILYIVKEIHEARKAGKTIYLHCKAGKARSAMIYAVYIALYGDMYPETKIKSNDLPAQRLKKAAIYMQSIRPQVDLHHEMLKDADWDALNEGNLTVRAAGKLFKAVQAIQLGLGFRLNTTNDDMVNAILEEEEYHSNEEIVVEEKQLITSSNDIFCSLKFKKDFIEFSSFKEISSFISADLSTKRSKAFRAFLEAVYYSTNSKWYLNLCDCIDFLIIQGGAKGDLILQLPEHTKQSIRAAYGPFAHLVTNSKMDESLYNLLMKLRDELHRYKTQYVPEPRIEFNYALDWHKDQLRHNTAEQQFQRDVLVWNAYLSQKQGDSKHDGLVTDLRINVMKRLFLTLQHGSIQFRNGVNNKYEFINSTNQHLVPTEQLPLASLLGHGGRILIELPTCSPQEAQQFFHWLVGGHDKISLELNSDTAAQQGCPVYHRSAASHSVEIVNGVVEEKKLPAVPLNPIDMAYYVKDWVNSRHWGMDLGMCEETHAAKEDGAHGHTYMYWLAPTTTEPGALLVGCEGSSPTSNKISYYGIKHDALHAQSNEFSLTGGMKFNHPSFNNCQIRPYGEGGIKLALTSADLQNLLSHDANDFNLADLSQSAGTPGCGYNRAAVTSTTTSVVTTPNAMTIQSTPVISVTNEILPNSNMSALPISTMTSSAQIAVVVGRSSPATGMTAPSLSLNAPFSNATTPVTSSPPINQATPPRPKTKAPLLVKFSTLKNDQEKIKVGDKVVDANMQKEAEKTLPRRQNNN